VIPGGQFTVEPVVSPYEPPYNLPYQALRQVAPGGIAIGNPLEGRLFQNWIATYVTPNIVVNPEFGPTAFTLPVPNAETVSLAFDNNMGIVLAWQFSSVSYLYYFDTDTASYTTRSFSGTTSCRICVDNSQQFYNADSDVIFAYTTGTELYYAQQRDKYNINYLVGASTKDLIRIGPSTGNRLQFELK
jgi:hypothetical protein